MSTLYILISRLPCDNFFYLGSIIHADGEVEKMWCKNRLFKQVDRK